MQAIPLGTHVLVIDRNGMVALGHLQKYRTPTDDYSVVYFEQKAEVAATTDQSASGRFGDFGGAHIQMEPPLQINGAVHFNDPRAGQPRFIFVDEDQALLNPPETQDQKQSADAAAAMFQEQPGVSTGQEGPGAAPAPEGQVPEPEHPTILPGTVQEPEPIPETKAERKERRREGLEE